MGRIRQMIRVNGRESWTLFRALAMQPWGIRLIPDREELDLFQYPSEFVEV